MLKIRLTRKGKKNKAFFRLVVAEHSAPIKGKFIEVLGFFNPHSKEKNFEVDRIKHWLERGAQCSDTVHNLLVKEGALEEKKRAVKIRKKEDAADKADIADKAEGKAEEEEKEKKEESAKGGVSEKETEKEKEEAKDKKGKEDKADPVPDVSQSDAGGEKNAKAEKQAD